MYASVESWEGGKLLSVDRHDLASRVLGKFAVWSTIYTRLFSRKNLWLVAKLVTQVPADSEVTSVSIYLDVE